MKTMKTLGLVASLTAGALWAGPALADVTVFANIHKDKDVTVDEFITITKIIDLHVFVDIVATHAAESLAIVNVTNAHNFVTGDEIDRKAEILRSIGTQGSIINDELVPTDGNVGVISFNQDMGDNTNQGNVAAIGLTEETGDQNGFTNAEVSVDQRNNWNEVDWDDDIAGVDVFRILTAKITSSISWNIGVVLVNQNVGNNNNQTNAVAVAAGLGESAGDEEEQAMALSEADLGQENTYNLVNETFVTSNATIQTSVNFNQGIVGVNQATGSNSNQANVVSFAASLL